MYFGIAIVRQLERSIPNSTPKSERNEKQVTANCQKSFLSLDSIESIHKPAISSFRSNVHHLTLWSKQRAWRYLKMLGEARRCFNSINQKEKENKWKSVRPKSVRWRLASFGIMPSGECPSWLGKKSEVSLLIQCSNHSKSLKSGDNHFINFKLTISNERQIVTLPTFGGQQSSQWSPNNAF